MLKVIVPAAGEGTRFLPLSMYQEKSLFYVAGKPVVRRIVDDILASLGNDVEIIITVDQMRLADFKHEFRDLTRSVRFAPTFSPSTVFSYETAILTWSHALSFDDILLHYADSFVEGVDYQDMYNNFLMSAVYKECLLAVTKNLRHEYSEVTWDATTNEVRNFQEKPTMPAWTWTGIAFFRHDSFMQTRTFLDGDSAKLDFGKDIFPAMIQRGQAIHAYPITGRYVDCGNILGYWRFMKENETKAKESVQTKTRS